MPPSSPHPSCPRSFWISLGADIVTLPPRGNIGREATGNKIT